MVAAGLSGAISIGGIGFIEIIADRFYSGVAGFLLIAVPYFIFTAELMNRAKLTDRLVAFANSLFGKAPGALSHVNVIVSILFAGLTGAAVTDTVAIGKTLIPAMKLSGPKKDGSFFNEKSLVTSSESSSSMNSINGFSLPRFLGVIMERI